MPSCVVFGRISRVSGQPTWNVPASCPCSKRPTPDHEAFTTEQINREFGSPGLPYPNGMFAVQAKDLARVKGDFCAGIGELFVIDFHASLSKQSRDFATRLLQLKDVPIYVGNEN